MISTIRIRDFAIIKDTKFQFHPGLNIITGETGSGKSIVATAMSLALGSRADTTFVRHGASSASVTMEAEYGDATYHVQREVSTTGKNQIKINHKVVPLGRLVSLSEGFAQIHGQFDNSLLLDSESHINLIDSFSHREIYPIQTGYAKAYQQYIHIKTSYANLLAREKDNLSKSDFYIYAIDEIDKAQLSPNEDRELENRLSVLQNNEKIVSALASAYHILCEDDASAENSIGSGLSQLQSISGYTDDLATLHTNLESISYELSDIGSLIRDYLDASAFSPNELDEVMERLSLIDSLKKKYGSTIDDILKRREEMASLLDEIEYFDEKKSDLHRELIEAKDVLEAQGDMLSKARKVSGDKLCTAVSEELKHMNFSEALMEARFEALNSPTPTGYDKVELYISTNRGEPLKPLAKIASGGEISRIMLAIKGITANYEGISTLIFDEVDTGISGVTASVVGEKLHQLAQGRQVICITHLPQIAAKGDHNYRIYKESNDSETFTYVEELTQDEKVEEIARLLSGNAITENTLKNARELITGSTSQPK